MTGAASSGLRGSSLRGGILLSHRAYTGLSFSNCEAEAAWNLDEHTGMEISVRCISLHPQFLYFTRNTNRCCSIDFCRQTPCQICTTYSTSLKILKTAMDVVERFARARARERRRDEGRKRGRYMKMQFKERF